MSKLAILEQEINEILIQWNLNNSRVGSPYSFSLVLTRRKKKEYLNVKDWYQTNIAELIFTVKDSNENKSFICYRTEIPFTNDFSEKTNNVKWKNQLLKRFLYECFGVYASVTKQLNVNKSISEYDLEKDRVKPNPDWEGKTVVISSTEEDSWFRVGEEFDIFNHDEYGWLVYTSNPLAKKENGIARIQGKFVTVKEYASKEE